MVSYQDTGQPWPLQKCLLLAPYGGSQQQKYLEAFVIHRLGLKHLGCLKWSSHIHAPAAQCWAMDLRTPMTLLTLHSHHNPQYQSNLGSPALPQGETVGWIPDKQIILWLFAQPGEELCRGQQHSSSVLLRLPGRAQRGRWTSEHMDQALVIKQDLKQTGFSLKVGCVGGSAFVSAPKDPLRWGG